MTAFDNDARTILGSAYPETPIKLHHGLCDHPLLDLEPIAALAGRLPEGSVQFNLGDLPLGLDGKPPRPDLPAQEAIRRVAETGTWTVLARIEQDEQYRRFLDSLLGELRAIVEPVTGPMLMPQGFIFVTSPGGVVPFHLDPEHNILMQARGSKTFTCFPADDPAIASDEAHEAFHASGAYTLAWDDTFAGLGHAYELTPGEALYVPVKMPHHVRNGPEPSVSLSITWRSRWSFAEADARAFNGFLRRIGFRPRRPGRWPHTSPAKAIAWRVMRKLRLG